MGKGGADEKKEMTNTTKNKTQTGYLLNKMKKECKPHWFVALKDSMLTTVYA
jgi:hypothetical protein